MTVLGIRRGVFLAIFLALIAPRGTAAAAAAASVAAVRIVDWQPGETAAVRIDGGLTESAWETAPVIHEFVQREPREGAAPAFRTEARILYNRSHLFVAIRAFDPDPSRLVGIMTRRDEDSPSDWLRVMVDSYYDRRSGYEFAVNPVGVKQDQHLYNDDQEDESWDGVWDVAVGRDEEGWTAEFRIPFSQLRFEPGGSATFGLALSREVARLNEESTWPLLPRSAAGYVSSFGRLTGLSLDASVKRLELTPYAVTQVSTEPAESRNELLKHFDPDASLGLDAKYALSPGLTLTGTINPDFGQVEADPAVVNLTAFETFFEERRPFFIEGAGIFRFDIDCTDDCAGLFYSRRIGREPQGEPDTTDDATVVSPAQSTILGAGKLTGRIGNFSLGALTALTGKEEAQILDGGLTYRDVVEPMTGYTVLRARREFPNQSSLGLITTATMRQHEDGLALLSTAFTGGLDWDLRPHPMYSVTGYWAGSALRGSEESIAELQQSNVHSFQRPDASHVDFDPGRTSLRGHAGLLAFSKLGGEHLQFGATASFKSPGFDINDVGFLQRADQRLIDSEIEWRNDRPSRYLRSYRLGLSQAAGWNFDGDRLGLASEIEGSAEFTNNWQVEGEASFEAQGFDDRLSRGGPGGRYPGSWEFSASLDSDDRYPVTIDLEYSQWQNGHGSRAIELGPEIEFRPTSSLMVSAGIEFERSVQDAQWIDNLTDGAGEHYLFGRLDQTTLGVTTRIDYTVTPNLSLQMYAEPFVSSGDYVNFRELVDGRAARYENRYAPFAYAENPDFTFRSFRTTNVVRWEYSPGSTLFVVWQQGREDERHRTAFSLDREFRRVFDVPARNTFLVKLSYWLNF